jgi:signal transduction histidine kinase
MIPVPFDQISLREVVFNLVSNGLEAAGAGGSVCLTCRHEPKQLVIEVHDTGPGFTAEQRPRMFEPFFTTKPTGTGLGLYIVARRVKDLGGQIECQSIPQQGTLFSMRFPLD